ncbi:MAG: hypothetical protein P8Y64_00040 [Gammaproteobacteria bacterium]
MQPQTLRDASRRNRRRRLPVTAEEVRGYTASQIRRLQVEEGGEPCFRSDDRYTCQERNCALTRECQRLIASWMR